MRRRSGASRRWTVLWATLLLAVPLAGVDVFVTAGAAGAAVTTFTVATHASAITVGPYGALWVVNGQLAGEGAAIDRVTTSGVVTNTYTSPQITNPSGLTLGPDGAFWFINSDAVGDGDFSIDRLTTSGTVTSFRDSTLARPGALTVGPDGALWFINGGTFKNGTPTADKGSIGRITTSGIITNYRDPSVIYPGDIAAGSDGALWFTNTGGAGNGDHGSIGRITTNGVVSNFNSAEIQFPATITTGSDGALWFTNDTHTTTQNYSIGRITTDGAVTKHSLGFNLPNDIAAGPDGAMWFTADRSIGRIDATGSIAYVATSPTTWYGLTVGPDGALWLENYGPTIGRITTSLTATAPIGATATPGIGQATVRWVAPAESGTAPITGYEVVPFAGDAAQAPRVFNSLATTQTVTGLTNGKTYQFRIAALNANGTGAFSDLTHGVTVGPPSGWNIMASPTSSGSRRGAQLYGVSCTSASSCFAVGAYYPSGHRQPLIERWNGTTWSIVPGSANGGVLNGVSCANPSSCFAVGATKLIERWNGTRWSISPVTGGSTFFGVSCPSPTRCFAVGNNFGAPVIELWNGIRWSVMTAPTATGYLTSVSCSSTKDCLAVGLQFSSHSMIMHWNGVKWSTVAGPVTAAASVSCPSATSCFVIGAAGIDSTGARWNGAKWTSLVVPENPITGNGQLNGISCASPKSCVAVGIEESKSGQSSTGTVVERWDGTRWSVVTTPAAAGGSGYLNSVSCTSIKCFAVGYTGAGYTLIERS